MNLLVFEAFRILTRNVFPQNLALKQHLRKSDSIKMDGKHSLLGVPDDPIAPSLYSDAFFHLMLDFND